MGGPQFWGKRWQLHKRRRYVAKLNYNRRHYVVEDGMCVCGYQCKTLMESMRSITFASLYKQITCPACRDYIDNDPMCPIERVGKDGQAVFPKEEI